MLYLDLLKVFLEFCFIRIFKSALINIRAQRLARSFWSSPKLGSMMNWVEFLSLNSTLGHKIWDKTLPIKAEPIKPWAKLDHFAIPTTIVAID